MAASTPFRRLLRRRPTTTSRPSRRLFAPEPLESRDLLAVVISGFVYHDVNNNGIRVPGETPIANSTIQLQTSGGAVVGNAVTDANGFYQFMVDERVPTNPQTQSFSITVPEPPVDPNSAPPLVDYSVNRTLPRFDPSLGTLQSVQFINDLQITIDVQLASTDASPQLVTFNATGNVALTVDGLTPSQNGTLGASTSQQFAFQAAANPSGIPSFDPPTGETFPQYVFDPSPSPTLTLNSGTDDLSAFIGTTPFNVNVAGGGTSQQITGGNVVSIIQSRAYASVSVIYTYTPNNMIQPGDYLIVQTTQPPGYLDGLESRNGVVIPGSAGGPDQIPLTVTPNTTDYPNNDFGEILPASLGGFVYVDANNNGIFEPGEQPIPGTTITLTGTNDIGQSINIVQLTDGTGAYLFSQLRPGTYTVTETQPAGYLDGKDTQGTPGTGTVSQDVFQNITLDQGVDGRNNNFGELLPASLSGYVFLNIHDHNNVFDADDIPIANVTVNLTGTDDLGNDIVLSAITAADGSYAFDNLRPGSYTVREIQPPAFLNGPVAVGSLGGIAARNAIGDISVNQADNGILYNFAERLKAQCRAVIHRALESFQRRGVFPGAGPNVRRYFPLLVNRNDPNVPANIRTHGNAIIDSSIASLRRAPFATNRPNPPLHPELTPNTTTVTAIRARSALRQADSWARAARSWK